jgi:hypothetical protein
MLPITPRAHNANLLSVSSEKHGYPSHHEHYIPNLEQLLQVE